VVSVPFLKFREHLGQIEILHIDVCILEILIEVPDPVKDIDVMDGRLKEVIDEVF
jgi:hypothetical protein